MRAVVQRVTEASVTVNGEQVSAIGRGLMVLLGVEKGDVRQDADYIAKKITGLRVFEDENDVPNLSVTDVGGSVLLVSQFTLCGDARKGRRPSYIEAEDPEAANALYEYTAQQVRTAVPVGTGVFRADMKVALVNDGPFTILLDSKKRF